MKSLVLVLVLLGVAPAAPKQAVLRWRAGGTYASSVVYRVYRSSSATVLPASLTNIAQLATSQTSFADRNVTPNKTYYYQVGAYDLQTGKQGLTTVVAYKVTPQ